VVRQASGLPSHERSVNPSVPEQKLKTAFYKAVFIISSLCN
jgi:hypothetical protein